VSLISKRGAKGGGGGERGGEKRRMVQKWNCEKKGGRELVEMSTISPFELGTLFSTSDAKISLILSGAFSLLLNSDLAGSKTKRSPVDAAHQMTQLLCQ
jgi:hypothetical protein